MLVTKPLLTSVMNDIINLRYVICKIRLTITLHFNHVKCILITYIGSSSRQGRSEAPCMLGFENGTTNHSV